MDKKKLKEDLMKMRDAIQEYLDNLNMESFDDKKDGKKKEKEEEDG